MMTTIPKNASGGEPRATLASSGLAAGHTLRADALMSELERARGNPKRL